MKSSNLLLGIEQTYWVMMSKEFDDYKTKFAIRNKEGGGGVTG